MGVLKARSARQKTDHIFEKKHYKKLLKVMNSVEKDLGAKLSPSPTKFVVLSNAGLANGATTSAILKALPDSCRSRDEATILPCQPILLPDKHYSFLQCITVEIAEESFLQVVTALSGRACFEFLGNQPVYAGYIDRAVDTPGLSFGPLPPGLKILQNRISLEEEPKWLELLRPQYDKAVPAENTTDYKCVPQSTASLKNRQVEHFGYNFDYSINGVRRDQPLGDKSLPPLCLQFVESLHQEGLLDKKHLPNQLTVNRYSPGEGIPAHCDTHSMFTSCIVIVSLGGDIVMEFRRITDGANQSAVSVLVPRGSIMFMADESRYGWTHSIAPRKYDLIPRGQPDLPPVAVARNERTSFTFRKVRSSEKPCECNFPNLCDSRFSRNPPAQLSLADREASKLEKMHVHEVYDDIAKHFSGTRYAQWPRVVEFLQSLPRGSLVADIGCGNGKNMRVEGRSDLVFLGSDRSVGLLDICRQRKLEVALIDCLQQPLRAGTFDAAICIAVLHHLANYERRREGLSQLIQLVRSGGKILVYVWAKEQRYTGFQSKYLKESFAQKIAKTENVNEQRLTEPPANSSRKTKCTGPPIELNMENAVAGQGSTGEDYTPMCSGLKSMKGSSDPEILSNGFRASKTALVQVGDTKLSIPVHTNRRDFTAGPDVLVPWTKVSEGQVKHRFYHIFREGELQSLVELINNEENEAPVVVIEKEYYDEGNWCVVLVKR
ncbi:alkylated DNA repair protein alkB homolog 8-like isoform X1 [Varroa destructor]|uniref:Fe2OG dioxygenase domain-containing protein n=1 Tax=Varroa destructor TaxID=109461 RepID=A0A7M7KXC9_VARDE|nr:alkylated DNA repair protein alkB homolog 8-like isoform X1 [Varroa destructor]